MNCSNVPWARALEYASSQLLTDFLPVSILDLEAEDLVIYGDLIPYEKSGRDRLPCGIGPPNFGYPGIADKGGGEVYYSKLR